MKQGPANTSAAMRRSGAVAKRDVAAQQTTGEIVAADADVPGTVFGELQTQHFGPIVGPRRLLHFAFATQTDAAVKDRARLETLCKGLGQPIPQPELRHHCVDLGDARLHWEQQNEFTSYTWEVAGTGMPLSSKAGARNAAMRFIEAPGTLLASVDLHIMPAAAASPIEGVFGTSPVGVSRLEGGAAIVASDLRTDDEGFTRILVSHTDLSPARAGVLVQRLLEIETCRALALLGVPEAQRLAPILKSVESALTGITSSMTHVRGPSADHGLLEELTGLAATLESESSTSGHRFRMTRAYDEIVQQRVSALDEQAVPGHTSFGGFVTRRLRQSMLNCEIVQDRLTALSGRLDRATELLRTRANVQIEHQNRDMLSAMTDRSQLQMRLQRVVEFIALAAISYYLVALAGVVFRGMKIKIALVEPDLATAVAVPVVFLIVWFILRRIRKRHFELST